MGGRALGKKRILVAGVDFSPDSKVALAEAVRIARRDGATLHVVHTIEGLVIADLAQSLGLEREATQTEVTADTREALAKLLSEQPRPAECQLHVLIGKPARELLELVERVGAELLVLGLRGATGGRRGVGSVASRCVRRSRSGVLLVHPQHRGPVRRLVVGVDFSATSRRAVEVAADFARRDGCGLEAVHVFAGPWNRLHYRAPTPQTSPDFQQSYRRALQARLEAFAGPAAAGTPEVEVRCRLVEHPNDGRGLAAYVNRRRADLLVLGARGRSELLDLLLGSTAERVLSEARCSVAMVPAAELPES
jgi:universal stress protein E